MSMTLPGEPDRIRRRLWKAAVGMGIFIVTLAIANSFLPPDRAVTRDMLGHDFLPFYAAGSMARQGQYADLYDLTAIKNLESATAHAAGITQGFGPWWNPPLAAWLFAPFTLLPFSRALLLWEAVSAAALAASIILLSRMIPQRRDWRNWGLIALLILDSNPLLAVFTHAQNTCITLLLICITVTFWRIRRGVAAGLAAGLLLYKPQHAPIIAMALIVSLGWPAAAGLAMSAATLMALTIFTMPGAMSDYVHKLPRIALTMQELSPYAWDRHVTLKAFWRLLFQGTGAGPNGWPMTILWWSSEAIVAALLARMAWRARRDPEKTDRLIAMTIAAGPLLALFCFDYDLVILAVPAVLCAGALARQRGILAAWIVLFVVMHISTFVARPWHFMPVAPALAGLVFCMSRARRDLTAAAPAEIVAPQAIAA